jgi:hypothetical protein
MQEILKIFVVLLIGGITGFIDSTVGSGGSVSIPSLIFIGLPPQVAIATDRLGSVGQTAAALLKFWKSGKIRWRYIPVFIIISLVGTAIGASILLSIDPKILQKLIGIILLILLPIPFLKNKLGLKRQETHVIKKIVGFIIYFFLNIFNGFLGVGAGGINYFNSIIFFGFTFIESNATQIIPWFLLSVFSLATYARGGIVDYKTGTILLIGMIIGGYIGAHIALKKGELWVKRLFLLVVIVACVRLLFF